MEGPQVNVAMGNQAQAGNGVGWQGMTIKDILEKVDLFNLTSFPGESNDEDVKKFKDIKSNLTMPDVNCMDDKSKTMAPVTNSAFLGPKIWKKPMHFYKANEGDNTVAGGDAASTNAQRPQFSVMNIDEFLTENNFDIGRISPPLAEEMFDQGVEGASSPYSDGVDRPFSLDDIQMDSEQPIESPTSSMEMPDSPISGFEMRGGHGPPSVQSSVYSMTNQKNESAKGGNEYGGLYVESKRAKMEREKEERRRREELALEFSAEDLALATVPGADFDPTLRHFSKDELRPQPIIRKRKKNFVGGDLKDDKYWEKRGKNNIAARRSREARRLKENQIALRTAFLEKQNNGLKAALQAINSKNEKLELEKRLLKEKLEKFESMAAFLN